jgi:hypothetical protein
MGTGLAVVPLALTMVLGPQILSAIFLVTSHDAVRNSIGYVVGFVTAAILGTAIAFGINSLIGPTGDPGGDSGDPNAVTYALVALLAFAALKAFLERNEQKEPPKWMGKLQGADRKAATRLGFFLALLMPTDVIAMLSVGGYLNMNGFGLVDAWPFLALTAVLIALPLIAYLAFGERAKRTMPVIRDWMNTNSWAITVFVCAFFIYALLG